MVFKDLESSTQVILKITFVVLALAFLWLIRDIILLLVMALILASAMDPMVDYFSLKRIPRAVSVLTVYVLVLGFAAFIVYLLVPPAVTQFQILSENWPEYVASFQNKLGSGMFSGLPIDEYLKGLFSGSGNSEFYQTTIGVFSGVVSFLTVLVISFYLVAEEKGMKQFVATLIPAKHQDFTLTMLEKIQKKMGLWILGQVILSFSIFLLTFVGLSALGVEYALFLALLAGLLEVVPYIGPFLSAVPAVFFAFIQNPPLALAVAILYLIVQKIEGYILVPKVMEKTVGTSPLVVLVALLIGYKLAGIVGLLIAVPLVSAVTVVINEFIAEKSKESPIV